MVLRDVQEILKEQKKQKQHENERHSLIYIKHSNQPRQLQGSGKPSGNLNDFTFNTFAFSKINHDLKKLNEHGQSFRNQKLHKSKLNQYDSILKLERLAKNSESADLLKVNALKPNESQRERLVNHLSSRDHTVASKDGVTRIELHQIGQSLDTNEGSFLARNSSLALQKSSLMWRERAKENQLDQQSTDLKAQGTSF